jgi:hypothetical protein
LTRVCVCVCVSIFMFLNLLLSLNYQLDNWKKILFIYIILQLYWDKYLQFHFVRSLLCFIYNFFTTEMMDKRREREKGSLCRMKTITKIWAEIISNLVEWEMQLYLSNCNIIAL